MGSPGGGGHALQDLDQETETTRNANALSGPQDGVGAGRDPVVTEASQWWHLSARKPRSASSFRSTCSVRVAAVRMMLQTHLPVRRSPAPRTHKRLPCPITRLACAAAFIVFQIGSWRPELPSARHRRNAARSEVEKPRLGRPQPRRPRPRPQRRTRPDSSLLLWRVARRRRPTKARPVRRRAWWRRRRL